MRQAFPAKRYLKGFFIIDLVSIVPFKEIMSAAKFGGESNYKLIRVIRIVRLAKLLRILRSSRIFQRFENHLTVSYGLIRLYKFLVMVLVLCHWLACLFNLVRKMEGARCNWAAAYFTDSPCLEHADDPIGASAFQVYIVAFYLAVMTTSTVGYGDVSPHTDSERICLIFAMLLGASVYAYVVGNICDIMGTLNARDSEFQEMMDSVNRFIKDSNLSKDLGAQIRSFFRYRRNATDMTRYSRIISTMSPQMRGIVALELNSHWMETVHLFDGCPENLLIEVSFVVKPKTFPPLEEFISTEHMVSSMFIIRRGLVASKGRVKGAGSVFGEDVILAKVPFKYTATTLTFVDAAILDRTDLELILESFPDAKKLLYKRAKRTSIRERMISFAKLVNLMAARRRQQDIAAEQLAEKKRLRALAKAGLEGAGNVTPSRQTLPPLDRPEMSPALPGAMVPPGMMSDSDGSVGEDLSEGEEDDEDEDMEQAASQMVSSRQFLDFDKPKEFLLPYGGILNALLFADERYRVELEGAATKIQARFRGIMVRKKSRAEFEARISAIREQIVEEQMNNRLKTKLLVEEGIITEEQAAEELRTPMMTPARLPKGAVSKPPGSAMMMSRPVATPMPKGTGVPAELDKIIRQTASKADILAANQDEMGKKVAEIYKIVLSMR